MAWTYEYGGNRIKLTAENVTEAIDTACSLLAKDLEFNERIRESEQFRHDYERKLAILRAFQRNVLESFDIMERKTVHMIIPGRRRAVR